MQPNAISTLAKRACTECARARERCDKCEPCQRCTTRNLQCVYPPGKVEAQNRQNSTPLSHTLHSPSPSPPFIRGLALEPGSVRKDTSTAESSHIPQLQGSTIPDHAQIAFTMPQQSIDPIPSFEVTNFVNDSHDHQLAMDFPMNWLPMDDSISIDYNNILGLDINSLGGFPSLPMVEANALLEAQYNLNRGADSVVSRTDLSDLTRRTPLSRTVGGYITSLNASSPSAVSGCVPFASPGSARQSTISDVTSDGLYATSTNDARMPCTTRWKRQKRLIPGVTPLRPTSELRNHVEKDWGLFEFADTSRIDVDDILLHADDRAASSPYLTSETYEALQFRFSELCLTRHRAFSMYSSSKFPSHASFDMFVHLYFENFDTIIPIMHSQVTNINNHWLLALAVCAVGCQYVEADEFSDCVVPLHELLRRGIAIELEAWNSVAVGPSEHEIALAQAMTLSQFGMFYSGSQRLLRHARAQHGALTELARSWNTRSLSSSTSGSIGRNDQETYLSAWRSTLFGECRRRIGYSIWVSTLSNAPHEICF